MTGPPTENLEFPCTDAAMIRAALARAEQCEVLKQEDALRRVLHFAVEETLAGRRCKVKPAPAARLRRHLTTYYAGEGQQDPVRIRLSQNSARPIFTLMPTPKLAPKAELKVEPEPASQPAPARAGRKLWIWLAIPVALALLVVGLWGGSKWRARRASEQIRSIAVLPLVDIDKQREGDWLRMALTGELIDHLARVPGLKVSSLASSAGVTGDLAHIGEQLGVAAVIQGNMRESGSVLKIEVTLIRTADGYQLWKDTYEREAPAITERLAFAIASRIRLTSAQTPPVRRSVSAQSFDSYLQGRYALEQHDLDRAGNWFEQATHTAPDFARAWAWLSMVRAQRVAAGKARPNQAMPEARDAAERAVALDDESADAHLALGIVKLQYDWEWAAAKAELDRVLQLAPSWALAMQWRAHWYQSQGQMAAADADLRHALALDPLSQSIVEDQAQQLVAAGHLDDALTLARKALQLNPGESDAKALLAEILFAAGHKDEAAKSIAGMMAPVFRITPLTTALGDPAAGRLTLDQAEDLPDEEMMPAIVYARIAAAIGDWNRYFAWLDEARGERDVQLPYLRLLPGLPKGDARLGAFLASLNLPPLQ